MPIYFQRFLHSRRCIFALYSTTFKASYDTNLSVFDSTTATQITFPSFISKQLNLFDANGKDKTANQSTYYDRNGERVINESLPSLIFASRKYITKVEERMAASYYARVKNVAVNDYYCAREFLTYFAALRNSRQ